MHIKFWRFVDTFSSFELDSLSFDFCRITHARFSYTDVYTCPLSQITAITASWQPLPASYDFTRLADFTLLYSYVHILLQYNNCANETQRRASNKQTNVWTKSTMTSWDARWHQTSTESQWAVTWPLLVTAASQLTSRLDISTHSFRLTNVDSIFVKVG